MRHHSISVTLVRLFAIGLVIYAFRNAGLAMFFLSEDRTEVYDLYMLLSGIGVPVVLAGFLWMTPARVVGRPGIEKGETPDAGLDPRALFSVGVALLGLYLAVTALAYLLDAYLTYASQQRLLGESGYRSQADYVALYSEVFLLIVGLVFFFGASGMTRLFWFARSFGLESVRTPGGKTGQAPSEARAAGSGPSDDEAR